MKTQESETNTGNAPTHVAYQVKDGAQKSHWTRIGAAWAHKDGKGFSVQLDSLPIDGRSALREASEN
ncbi:MAG: hypothetical protein ACOYNL_05565 [Rickettsiales bacterium]